MKLFPDSCDRRRVIMVASVSLLVTLIFALYSQHVWEDYYITYRSSKNLVEGHGLVYNVGERVHTFTSPLGVLLPAVASFVSGGSSDAAALWLFRAMSMAALAGGAVLMFAIARRWGMSGPLALTAGLWLTLDAKTVDFSINGMETAFLVLFLAYALWAHVRGPQHWKHQGAAWAGMMWTRPDCFVYVALMALAVLLFGTGGTRPALRALIVSWLKAGLLTTILYLPWTLWTWAYYGTPIPHTIVAKSGLTDPFVWSQFLLNVVKLPFSAAGHDNSMAFTFLPTYVQLGGWPAGMVMAGKVVAGVIGLSWLLPAVSARTRVSAFVFFGIHVYLTCFPYYYFPWYLPASTPFGVMAGTSLLADLSPRGVLVAQGRRWLAGGAAGLLLLGSLGLTVQMARQMRAQQIYIENGVRTEIGKYLHEHADPADTVFMEPLGYIGYFSGLKTYDYPGMSSPEMVAARSLLAATYPFNQKDWRRLITYLYADWVVLRPVEMMLLEKGISWRLEHGYQPVRTFSRQAEIEELAVPGLGYLLFDSTFSLYRRNPDQVQENEAWSSRADFGVEEHEFNGRRMLSMHAATEIHFAIPADPRSFAVTFGIDERATQGEETTDGVEIGFEVRDRSRTYPLDLITLDPVNDPSDVGMHVREFALPAGLSPHARLRVVVLSRMNRLKDWVRMSVPEFVP